MKKRTFLVEIEVPDNTGDLCWDQDDTGLQAFHECIAVVLPEMSLRWLVIAAKKDDEAFQRYIDRQNAVRESFKVLRPVTNTEDI